MEPEERNKKMDMYFDRYNTGIYLPAIRECDKLARAWDELKKKLQYRSVQAESITEDLCIKGVLHQMAELLTPTPKDPLEELERRVRELACRVPDMVDNSLMRKVVYLGPLLTEIRRLREEGKK